MLLSRLVEPGVGALEEILLGLAEELAAYLAELGGQRLPGALHLLQPRLERALAFLLAGGETRALHLGIGAGLPRRVQLLLHPGEIGDRLSEILGPVVALLSVERGLPAAEEPAGGGARGEGEDHDGDERGVHVAPQERRANLRQSSEMVKRRGT